MLTPEEREAWGDDVVVFPPGKPPADYVKMIDNSLKFRDVKKVPISSLSDIPDGMIVAVEYKYLGGSHLVVGQKRKVLFDPSEPSNSVRNGKPVSYRLFF